MMTATTKYRYSASNDGDSHTNIDDSESKHTMEKFATPALHLNLEHDIIEKLQKSPVTPLHGVHPRETKKNNYNDRDDDNGKSSPLHRKRGKLREKEERFNVLIKSTTNHMDEMKMLKCQLQNLGVALREKEADANELDKELRRCRKQISKIQTSNNAMSPIQNNLQVKKTAELATTTTILQEQLTQTTQALKLAQTESLRKNDKVAELECRLKAASDEITKLKGELEDRLRKLIVYEIDLETHNINFTNYAEEQQRLEEGALGEIFDTTSNANDNVDPTKEQAKIQIAELEKKHGCRTQQLVAKLLAENADMETRYKRDRIESAKQMEQLETENNDLKGSLKVLEQRQEKEYNPSSSMLLRHSSTEFFVQRINVLEREVSTQQETNKSLREQLVASKELLQATQDEAKQSATNDKQMMELMLLEMAAMSAKLAILDKPVVEDGANDSSSAQQQQLRVFAQLEQKIVEQNNSISKLLTERDSKDRQIASLRSEAVDFHMVQFLSRSPFNSSDSLSDDAPIRTSTSLKDTEESDGRSGNTAAKSETLNQLEQELQDMQSLLIQKEEELAVERKRFSTREADLLMKLRCVTVHPEASVEGLVGGEGESIAITPTPDCQGEQALFFF